MSQCDLCTLQIRNMNRNKGHKSVATAQGKSLTSWKPVTFETTNGYQWCDKCPNKMPLIASMFPANEQHFVRQPYNLTIIWHHPVPLRRLICEWDVSGMFHLTFRQQEGNSTDQAISTICPVWHLYHQFSERKNFEQNLSFSLFCRTRNRTPHLETYYKAPWEEMHSIYRY